MYVTKFAIAFTIVCSLLGSKLHAQQGTLYAVDIVADELVTIDTQTGNATSIGQLRVPGQFASTPVTAAAFDSAGVLFALVGSGDNVLLTLDTNTGAATRVSRVQRADAVSIIFDSAGIMYGISADRTSRSFYTIDPSTGSFNLIDTRSTLVRPGILAYDSLRDELYVYELNAQILSTIDRSTGDLTFVTQLSADLTGLAFDPSSDTFFGINGEFGDSDFGNLVTLDLGTGEVSSIGPLGSGPIQAFTSLAFAPVPAAEPIVGDFDADGDVDGDDVDFYIGNLNQPAVDELAPVGSGW